MRAARHPLPVTVARRAVGLVAGPLPLPLVVPVTVSPVGSCTPVPWPLPEPDGAALLVVAVGGTTVVVGLGTAVLGLAVLVVGCGGVCVVGGGCTVGPAVVAVVGGVDVGLDGLVTASEDGPVRAVASGGSGSTTPLKAQ